MSNKPRARNGPFAVMAALMALVAFVFVFAQVAPTTAKANQNATALVMDTGAAPGIFKEAHCDAILAISAAVFNTTAESKAVVISNNQTSVINVPSWVINMHIAAISPGNNASPPATVVNNALMARNGINPTVVTVCHFGFANIKAPTTEGGVPYGAELV